MFRLGVQIYCFYEDYDKSPIDCFLKVKDMGFEGIELYKSAKNYTAAEIKKAADEAGLVICGAHVPFDCIRNNFDDVVKSCETADYDIVIVPAPDKSFETEAEWVDFAREMNGYKKEFAKHNIRMGYHSHGGDFSPVDTNKLPWDIIKANTDPDFIMQLDTGNAFKANGKPEEIYAKCADRGVTVHYKPYTFEKGYYSVIGRDDIDWDKMMKISIDSDCEWVVIEQATGDLRSVAECAAAVIKMMR